MNEVSTTTPARPCDHGEPAGCHNCPLCRHHGCSGCYYGRPTYGGGGDRLYTLRLPVDLHEALKERALADDRRLAQTFRDALRTYLTRS